MQVWTLVIERFDGEPSIVRVFTTKQKARDALHAHVAKEWRKHFDLDLDPMPTDPDEAADEFFTHANQYPAIAAKTVE